MAPYRNFLIPSPTLIIPLRLLTSYNASKIIHSPTIKKLSGRKINPTRGIIHFRFSSFFRRMREGQRSLQQEHERAIQVDK